ncbi:MAG: cystathionine gamma-synthase family protein [Patescibacteria group bacterium]
MVSLKKRSVLRPESLMMSYGYKPELSEGALKPPIFVTSTWAFENAQEGRRSFELAAGLRKPENGEVPELIYSRFNHPDLQIVEERLCLWDNAEDCAIFSSGMAAISLSLLAVVRPGDIILFSEPLYGGTDKLIKIFLKDFGIETVGFGFNEFPDLSLEEKNRVAVIFLETPSNPTNDLFNIESWSKIAGRMSKINNRKVLLIVDNTFLGPLYQHPLELNADLVIYSATKFIGGHSDLIAGAALGSKELISKIKQIRGLIGAMSDPFTVWQILRSLETLKIRMTAQMENAKYVAAALKKHPAVRQVHYLGYLEKGTVQYRIYKKQCLSPGSMISFEIEGGEPAAYDFLNSLNLFNLAVSLGSTESLAQHPASMTHVGVALADRAKHGITDGLVRLSVGIENRHDLEADIKQALDKVRQ